MLVLQLIGCLNEKEGMTPQIQNDEREKVVGVEMTRERQGPEWNDSQEDGEKEQKKKKKKNHADT